jgi:polyphosphate kinase 2 (PPK2 family)
LAQTSPLPLAIPTPLIETVRQLPDGNWLLRVNGEERQTINLEQKRLMLTTQAERDSFALQIAALKDQVKAFEAIKAIDEKITANQAAMLARQDAWLESSGKLVFELQDALEAYRKAAKVGKVAAALNHPAWRIIATAAPILLGIVAR